MHLNGGKNRAEGLKYADKANPCSGKLIPRLESGGRDLKRKQNKLNHTFAGQYALTHPLKREGSFSVLKVKY